AQTLLPRMFRHQRHVGGLFFLRQKTAATYRSHAEDVEVVRRHLAAEKLHRIAQSSQSERDNIFALEPVENFLAGAEMLKPRHRDSELQQIALPGIRIHVHDASGLLKLETAQKQVV